MLSLNKEEAPNTDQLASRTMRYKRAIALAQYFCETSMTKTLKGKLVKVPMYGPEALNFLVNALHRKFKAGTKLTLRDLKKVQSFGWLITEDQEELLAEITSSIMVGAKTAAKTLLPALADGDGPMMLKDDGPATKDSCKATGALTLAIEKSKKGNTAAAAAPNNKKDQNAEKAKPSSLDDRKSELRKFFLLRRSRCRLSRADLYTIN